MSRSKQYVRCSKSVSKLTQYTQALAPSYNLKSIKPANADTGRKRRPSRRKSTTEKPPKAPAATSGVHATVVPAVGGQFSTFSIVQEVPGPPEPSVVQANIPVPPHSQSTPVHTASFAPLQDPQHQCSATPLSQVNPSPTSLTPLATCSTTSTAPYTFSSPSYFSHSPCTAAAALE